MIWQLDDVDRRLKGVCPIEYHPEISSTNDRALALAREDATRTALIVAEYQTAGRGRRGAPWVAPAGTSILASLLVPVEKMPPPGHLAILTGVSVAQGIKQFGVDAKIKWPNDIMVADRKVCGILVETVGQAVVIGFGINYSVPDDAFPPELRDRAGSLHRLTGQSFSREDVLAQVVHTLLENFLRVRQGGITKLLLPWNQLNWLMRRSVRVSGPLGVVDGDGLFINVRGQFDVFKDHGVVPMPLSSMVEVR